MTTRRAFWAVAACLLFANSALAGYTPLGTPAPGEASHEQILEGVYGGDFVAIGVPVGTGNTIYDNGVTTATRVDDDGFVAMLNMLTGAPGTGDDDIWTDGSATAAAEAKYAGETQEFGYDAGSGYVKLFDVAGSGLAVSGSGMVTFGPGSTWVWARAADSDSGLTGAYYSDPTMNSDLLDHMVTYAIDGAPGKLPTETVWLVCFEDRPVPGSDRDHNDLCVELVVRDCFVDADCDDGNECTVDTCSVDGLCEYSDALAGTACGNQTPEGVCDNADVCDGFGACVPNYEPSSTECRAAAGDCDVAEFCTGTGPDCPADDVALSGTLCRASAGVCDVEEVCDGVNVDCPADDVVAAGTLCRAAAGDCDAEEFCDGTNVDCPADVVEPLGTECRPVAGPCDVAELCDGTNVNCPADDFLPPLDEKGEPNICRNAAGSCDIEELCPGDSAQCPPDEFEDSTVECRPAFGVCDLPEFCTGFTPSCPANEVAPQGTLCRNSAGVCDVEEVCDGVNIDCPADEFLPDTTECRPSAGVCDPAEFCTGFDPDCPGDVLDNMTVCRPSEGVCDPEEICDGVNPGCPADVLDNMTVCRPSEGVCDPEEICDGVNPDCPGDILDSTSVCRPSAGFCDPEEICDGVNPDCPGDILDSTTICRPSAGVCDPEEICDGTNPDCPGDLLEPNTTECRPTAGECDLPEFCTGTGVDCPGDVFKPQNSPCTDDSDECTRDICDGLGVCTHPDNNLCGSCCLASKACVNDILQATCQGQGGTFNGIDVLCMGDSDGDGIDDLCDNCPGVDDIIFGTKICSDTGRHCSTDADCEPGDFCVKACIGEIPAASEWGLAILALLLLVAGKLYFGRELEPARVSSR